MDSAPDVSNLSPEIRNALLARLSALDGMLVRPFREAIAAFGSQDGFVRQWADLALELCGADSNVGGVFLQSTPLAVTNLGGAQVIAWAGNALSALNADRNGMRKAVIAYLREAASRRCGPLSLDRWAFYLAQAGRIAAVSPTAAEAFILRGRRVCLLLTEAQTRQWVTAGLAAGGPVAELIAFFAATTPKALETRNRLAGGVALKQVSATLALICQALVAKPVKIRSSMELLGIEGFAGGAATDGNCIYLPDSVPQFGLFKLMALHQAMLMACGKLLVEAGRNGLDPSDLHRYADKRLVQRMPALAAEMKRQWPACLEVPYPWRSARPIAFHPAWWGDILTELREDTGAALATVRQRAEQRYEQLPPGLVDMLIAHLTAKGRRDADELWRLLCQIVDQMDLPSPEAEVLPDTIQTFFYPEWDETIADFKPQWCLVRQRPLSQTPNGFAADLRRRLAGPIRLIRKQFARLKPEQFKKHRAQPFGDGLDIDALVAAVVDKRCGTALSENIYIRRDKRVRDVAVLFLVDTSASTEDCIQGRRVIDIQKEAMVLMAEALDALGDPYAIFGFTSEGRFRVDLFQVKDFAEAYTDAVRFRLGNLAPAGLTRMGTVIRHGICQIEAVPAAIRLMVILTDGRPFDLEYGTLDYAVADTKNAIAEARRKRIHPFIITSDKQGEAYLHRISPQTESIIVDKVESLPRLLPAIYKRLTA